MSYRLKVHLSVYPGEEDSVVDCSSEITNYKTLLSAG